MSVFLLYIEKLFASVAAGALFISIFKESDYSENIKRYIQVKR